MIGVVLYHLGAFFARILPRRVSLAIADTIGYASYLFRVRTRAVVVENLRIIHGGGPSESELRRRARRVILNFARSILIFLELPFYDADEIMSRSDFSEFEKAAEPLGKGQPFIIASAHLGPWELGGFGLTRLGYRIHTVALEHPSSHVTNFFSERRELLGVQAHPLKGSFHLLKAALDQGECVALLIDRAYSKARKEFTLFGVESEFPLGHLVLAMRCNVPVMTGAFVFDGAGRYRFVYGGTHRAGEETDEFERLENLQEKCLRDLETIIRAHSDQWFYFRPLNRTEAYGS